MTYYDPRVGGAFRAPLWPRQREFASLLGGLVVEKVKGSSLVCDVLPVPKPRDVSATWTTVGVLVWGVCEVPGFSATVGSYVWRAVERKGDMGSYMEKARFVVRNLPARYRASRFGDRLSRCLLSGRVVSPVTNGAIVAHSGTSMGRSSRATVSVADEFAFYRDQESTLAALTSVCSLLVLTSTHSGPGTEFARLCSDPSVRTFAFNWRDNPSHTDEWFRAQERMLPPAVFAREVLAIAEGSRNDLVLEPSLVDAGCRAPLWSEGPLPLPHVYLGYDVGFSQRPTNAVAARVGDCLTECYTFAETDVAASCARVWAKACSYLEKGHTGVTVVFDSRGVGGLAARKAFGRLWHLSGTGVRPELLAFDGQALPSSPSRRKAFANRRAEAYFRLRERLESVLASESGGPAPSGPSSPGISWRPSAELRAELGSVRYSLTAAGKLKVESKAGARGRGQSSPHMADAVSMAFWPPGAPVARSVKMARPGRRDRSVEKRRYVNGG